MFGADIRGPSLALTEAIAERWRTIKERRKAMRTTYTILHVDGTTQRGEIDWPEHPTLDQIKILVEPIVGSPMEHVRVLDPDSVLREDDEPGYLDMFVDEHGHERIKPRNEAATAFYRANWLHHEGGDPDDLPWIAGTAVVFDRIVWS